MDEKYEGLKLDNQLCFPLYAASKEIVKKYRPYLDRLGLTYTQYITLMVLWEHKRVNVKDLGTELFLDSGTLSPVLKSLEKKGYIKRERNEDDQRVLNVAITLKGEELKDSVINLPKAVASNIKLDQKEAFDLYNLLYKILKSINE